ncbi:peroxiredoxin type-2 [Mycoemilia scoparia]|uniref:Thioredoxin-dependent peroxiredoxin n=1 Tax=Mycoemilia scoparia TaxID=417184 RepID=A0A9W7ZW71_9FUNG|nr:peroxiredoxin type-2 [Mycoemilia scoparia]
MASIREGDTIPDFKLTYVPYNAEAPDVCGVPQTLSTHKYFAGKKIVLFGVPGAFTPTCSEQHFPGYIEKYNDIVSKGVDKIICVATNDHFVMDAWGKKNKVEDRIIMASDALYELGNALGLLQENKRLKRFAMIINDLKVETIGVEPPNKGGVTVSGAEHILSKL